MVMETGNDICRVRQTAWRINGVRSPETGKCSGDGRGGYVENVALGNRNGDNS